MSFHSHAFSRGGAGTRASSARWQPQRAGLCAALASAALLGACTGVQPVAYSPPPAAGAPVVLSEPPPVVSVYAEAPLVQPAPLLVPWAPPPMLVQAPPPAPFADAVWVGGYWAWQSRWVWSAGYWAPPPRPGYLWVEPYYEHRGNAVVFVNGFWCAPGLAFVPPPPTLRLTLSVALPGVVGTLALGPQGVFVPPPPGSALGLIVPAPIGTPPAVVTGAPAIIHGGMHIADNHGVTINNTVVNNTVINNRITNVRNVIIEAPASATADHRAFRGDMPAHAALAAAVKPMTHWQAPLPQTQQRFNLAAAPGREAASLPPPQPVRRMAPGQPAHAAQPPAPPNERAAGAMPPERREPLAGMPPRPDARPPQARLPVEHAPTAPAPLELERAPEARTAPEHLPDRRIDGSAPRPEMPALAPPPQARDNERPREVRPALIRPEPEPAARPANTRAPQAPEPRRNTLAEHAARPPQPAPVPVERAAPGAARITAEHPAAQRPQAARPAPKEPGKHADERRERRERPSE